MALAKPLGAKVTVLTVSEPQRSEMTHAARQQIDAFMRDRLASIGQHAFEGGVTVDLEHEIDVSPAAAIIRLAKLKGCDLVVMSSHGRRGIQKVVLGSQTSEVLAITTIPVLVIR
ncbi:universal stress protein family [Bosea sp. BIWAKO-01]|nr:universal stress protein family [Bosea sp. BIWAKO-01]